MTCPNPILPSELSFEHVHGTEDASFVLLLIAEGYVATEQTKFQNDCTSVALAIANQDWYAAANGSSNFAIWSCFIASDGGSAMQLPPGAGPPAYPLPPPPVRFGTGYDSVPDTREMFTNSTCVLDAKLQFLTSHQGIKVDVTALVVNYGGVGGLHDTGVPIATTCPDFTNLMLHELGQGFTLSDEYAGTPGVASSYPGWNMLNASSHISALPWRKLRGRWICIKPWKKCFKLPNFPWVSKVTVSASPDCKYSASTSSHGQHYVGAFEGANRAHCEIYRPSIGCRMRNYNADFCIVCSRVLKERIDGTLDPTVALD